MAGAAGNNKGMTSRIIPLEGVDNFRDYGDYRTAAGRLIRPGRLYRSANHAGATDDDLEAIAALARQHGLIAASDPCGWRCGRQP